MAYKLLTVASVSHNGNIHQASKNRDLTVLNKIIGHRKKMMLQEDIIKTVQLLSY